MEIIKHPLFFIMIMTIVYMIINKLNFRHLFKNVIIEFISDGIIDSHKLMLIAVYKRAISRGEYQINQDNIKYDMKINDWRERRKTTTYSKNIKIKKHNNPALASKRNRDYSLSWVMKFQKINMLGNSILNFINISCRKFILKLRLTGFTNNKYAVNNNLLSMIKLNL